MFTLLIYFSFSFLLLLFIYICGHIIIFYETFESRLRIMSLYPLIFQYAFLKNKDILLNSHRTISKFQKYNMDTILLSKLLSIFQLNPLSPLCPLFEFIFSLSGIQCRTLHCISLSHLCLLYLERFISLSLSHMTSTVFKNTGLLRYRLPLSSGCLTFPHDGFQLCTGDWNIT